MADLPILRGFDADAVMAYREGKPISRVQFQADVLQLAKALPAASYMINLCSDRYRFSVGFAAALLRRQVNLLPPNQTADLFERLSRTHCDAYCLVDGELETGPFRRFAFPTPPIPHRGAADLPLIPGTQIAAVVLTSGSTGDPVPHPKTFAALVRSVSAEFTRFGLEHGSAAILATVPPQHMYGLESSVMLPLQGGLAMHAGRPFYPADVIAELEALPGPRALITTPVHLRALIADGTAAPETAFVICATAPLQPQLAAATEERFGAPLHEVYGCTEAGQLATRRTVKTSEWHALPGIAMRQDTNGTWIRGGHVAGEILLNDVIELHSRDRFLLHGRKADLVNIAGKRTSLAHLNYHLNSIEGVRDGVFVVPQNEQGETGHRLMALVVAPGLGKRALMAALRRRIDPAFLPRPLCFVDALPRNEASKLPRAALDNLISELATRAA